jgi:single-stranded-DNA-specific exonuclease
MEKSWKFKNNASPEDIAHLTEVLNVDQKIATLLAQRGIRTFDQAKAFFRPLLNDLHDPFLMKDMEKAVDRIDKAILNNEKVLIYGDYDVDGTTSVALLFRFLKRFPISLGYYIPNRYSEGYGISYKAIDYAKANNYTLVVALDCGIKAYEKINYANELKVDFIICDHHYPSSDIPKAIAVLDPKRPDCNYPCKHLSGCGVGFKLIQAISIHKNIPFDEISPFLDMVVVSIASDIVPIIEENRVLAFYGLKILNESPCTGLNSIIKIAGLKNTRITIDDIVFKIGPRINAAGRMESGDMAVSLLVADEENKAEEIAQTINNYNNRRKDIDNSITQEALQMIGDDDNLKNKMSTVLFNANWHKGVIGIVASRLTETYYRPTVILTQSNGLATGSARSVVGFDLYQAIDACSDLLENFGGHMFAAGLTMKLENIQEFSERFETIVSNTIQPDQMKQQMEIDVELDLKDITPKFYRLLKQFEPYGPENMMPVFLSEEVVDNGCGRIVGSSNEHLKLELIQEQDPFKVYPAIGFSQANHFKKIGQGKPFDIIYSIDENEFRGNTTLQLRIKDMKFWD